MKPKVQNWINLLKNGIIESNTVRVLFSVHKHTKSKQYTNIHQLRDELNIKHQTLTAVLSMVQDEGMIDMFGETEINGTKYQQIRYAHPSEREQLIMKRKVEKFRLWLDKIDEHECFIQDDVKSALKTLKNDLK